VGKSDVALRLLQRGWRLLSDDQTHVVVRDGVAQASSPLSISGMMEVRGVGVVSIPGAATSGRDYAVALVVDLVNDPSQVERLPDLLTCDVMGVSLPCVRVYGFAASAPDVITVALEVALGHRSVFC